MSVTTVTPTQLFDMIQTDLNNQSGFDTWWRTIDESECPEFGHLDVSNQEPFEEVETESEVESKPLNLVTQICYHFLKGKCRFGDSCDKKHTRPVCTHFTRGKCDYPACYKLHLEFENNNDFNYKKCQKNQKGHHFVQTPQGKTCNICKTVFHN